MTSDTATVLITKPVTVAEQRIVITMTPSEAQAVANLIAHVSGSPVGTTREVRDRLADHLERLGYAYQDDVINTAVRGNIHCTDSYTD